MTMNSDTPLQRLSDKVEGRIVIHAPTGKDARLIAQVFSRANIDSFISHTWRTLVEELAHGAGALVIADDTLTPEVLRPLVKHLNEQPTWSDLPVLVLSTRGQDSSDFEDRYSKLGNVSLLERPAQSVTLVSAAKSALRARRRQYEMREIDRRKDEFLAMLAHELRNPLAPVSAAAALLKLPNLDKERIAKTSEIITRQVSHMTELIDDLLDASRVSRGLVTLSTSVLDIRGVVSNAVEQVSPIIEQRGHFLSVRTRADAIFVEGDEKRLIQIVANLLHNAAKYTPPAGKIDISLEVVGSEVTLTISDSGIGMEADVRTRVFEMFSQAKRTPDRSQGGLGIGLALVKNLVDLHGGKVEANSAGIGEGSTFVVRIPQAKVQPVPKTPSSEAVLESLAAPLRVVIVDDNADAAEMLSVFLQTAAYETAVAHTAQGGIELAETIGADVFLLDIGLPDMSGMRLAKLLRALPEGADAMLIAVTGYGSSSDSQAALDAGFNHHMVKPVQMDKLLSLLSAHGKTRVSAS